MPFVRPADVNGPDLGTMTFRQKWTPTARGWALIIMALSSAIRGLSYLSLDAPPEQLAFVDMIIPDIGHRVWWLAALWLVVAAGCVGSLIARRWIAALGVAVSTHLLWATSLVVSTVVLGDARSWASAITYFTVAGLCVVVSAMQDSNDA